MKKTNKKSLICHRYFWPENISLFPSMLKDYVDFLNDNDYEVHMVTGYSKKCYLEKSMDIKSIKANKKIFKAEIDRNQTLLSKIINSVKFVVLSFYTSIKVPNIDLSIFVSYPPFFTSFLIILFKIFNRSNKNIFVIQDNIKYRLKSKVAIKLYLYLLRKSINYCDAILILSDDMKNEILSYFNPNDKAKIGKKLYVLNNYIENYNSAQLLLKKEIDIVFAGNHGLSQNLLYFLEIISKLRRVKNLSIAFYGDGDQKKELVKYAKEKNINQFITFNDYVSRVKINEIFSKSKFGLVGACEDLFKYAYPSKIINYGTSGLVPIIIANQKLSFAKDLKGSNAAIFIDPSLDTCSAAVKLEKELDKFQKINSKDIAKYYKYSFSKDKYFKALNRIISEVG